MFKSLVLALGLVVTSCSAFPAFAAPDIMKPFNATVQLNDNCSGTIIKSDRDEVSGKVETLILTAKHCTSKNDAPATVNIWEYDKQMRQIIKKNLLAKVRGQWFKGDLALIELTDKDNLYTTVATVAKEDFNPTPQSEVVAIGFPMGLEKSITDGRFVSRLSTPSAPIKDEMFLTTVKVAGGSSGGGLYAEIDGEYRLIGVASMTASAFPWAFFVPIDQVRSYISVAIPKGIDN